MKVLDLFSGIGGFSLGLERAGPFRTVAFCEREAFPQAVLRKHWPEVPIYDDVRTIPTERLGRIDVICGGFPCQPWSVAGEQRGAEDDRDLWPVMASLIEKLRPRWVIGENVRGFVNEPMGLQRSLSDLESIGYKTAPFVIPACAVDAPHRRDRVWIAGYSDSAHTQGGRVSGRMHAEYADADSGSKQRLACKNVADAKRRGRQGQGEPVDAIDPAAATSRQAVEPVNGGERGIRGIEPGMGGMVDGIPAWLHRHRGLNDANQMDGPKTGATSDADFERVPELRGDVQTNPHQEPQHMRQEMSERDRTAQRDEALAWEPEPDIGRVATGVKNRSARLKALGNAVIPQVVEQIGRAILEAEA